MTRIFRRITRRPTVEIVTVRNLPAFLHPGLIACGHNLDTRIKLRTLIH